MNELIKVAVNDSLEQIVSARELHEKLGIKQDFTSWFKYQAEKIGILEGLDFSLNLGESTGGRPSIDYNVTLEIAKHLAMISGGEKAHEIRKYFIEIEKAWNNPEMVMARSLQFAQTKLLNYQKQIELMQPKADFYDDVMDSKTAIEVGEVAKVLNMGMGRNTLFEFLRDNAVLMSNNAPYQKYIDKGWFRLVETKYTKPNGDNCINIKTVVFQKGVDGIRKMLKDR